MSHDQPAAMPVQRLLLPAVNWAYPPKGKRGLKAHWSDRLEMSTIA